jgi:geranylgeranyl pyrophosphate synthase
MIFNFSTRHIKKHLSQVNRIIDEAVSGVDPSIKPLYDYIMQARGKQIRSVIMILIGETIADKSKLYTTCAGIELIHLASLIHDDIVDNATRRRELDTIHQRFGKTNALLMGVHCYSLALRLFSRVDNYTIARVSEAVTHLCEGEFIQVNHRSNHALSEADYWTIVQKKTTPLFAVSCELATYFCGLPPESHQKMYRIGTLIGDLFQLIDDILDFYGKDSSKNTYQDIAMGDMSLPMIWGLDLNPHLEEMHYTLQTNKHIIQHKTRGITKQKVTSILDLLNDINLPTAHYIHDVVRSILSQAPEFTTYQ